MKIKVSVPATSANVGSGFDALGLAVTLYNTVTFEDSEVLEISASDGTRIPRGTGSGLFFSLHHRGSAGRKPDAGRCAQHAGVAHAGNCH